MNIHMSGLPEPICPYFAIGNTPPVCLTQDLPPEQSADILLLGCGDARNILFTCFADNARKIDVTCCDNEPMIHARNVLLYTLLIDDKANQNIELIWNIYYHWKIDENSMKLIESQVQKLLMVSDSVHQWHSSVYGSVVRFCDDRSLSLVRCHWKGFSAQDLSPAEKQDWLNQLQAAIDRAKENRNYQNNVSVNNAETTGYQSLFPTAINVNEEAMEDLCKLAKHWWDNGTVPSSNLSKPTHLNPIFLFSPNPKLTIYQGVTPVGGIPLSTAYIALDKGSPFCVEKKAASSAQHMVNCAKTHFKQWAPAFRRAVENGSIIRVFSGHAFAFCFTLRNCQLTGSRSMNLFCSHWTNSPLVLNDSDYGPNSNAAPLNFDIIDTSNLADYLGPLNLIALASSLLKCHVSSCLYTQLMVMFDYSMQDRVTELFGVDLRTLSFLLGLVPPDLVTNVANSLEEYPHVCKNGASDSYDNPGLPTAHSRLRWRRFGSDGKTPVIDVEAEELAKFLIQVHDAMFQLEDMSVFKFLRVKDVTKSRNEMYKILHRPYNRASFAFLLSVVKATVTCDWDKCLTQIQDKILSKFLFEVNENNFIEDMILNLHIFGVDSSRFTMPIATNMNGTILASVLSECEELPEQLCVTVRIPKEHLPAIPTFVSMVCNFETQDRQHSFSSVQISFGKWCEPTEKDNSFPYIEENAAYHTSDVLASVLVPTSMLISMVLQSNQFVPMVKFTLTWSPMAYNSHHKKMGPELCFFSCEITSKNVFITRFMPGMSGLPVFAISEQQNITSSDKIAVRFSDDCSKINSLIQRITLKTKADKTVLAKDSSAVKTKFDSPSIAVVSVGGSLQLKFEFPVPVSVLKRKLRIARNSSYLEFEAGFFDPVNEENLLFLSPCFLTKTPCGIVPAPWTSMRIDLDVMPSLDLSESKTLTWLFEYLQQGFSRREYQLFVSNTDDSRMTFKSIVSCIIMNYAGHSENREFYFTLEDMYRNVKALILPAYLRLDLANQTVALDAALIPFTSRLSKDPLLKQFLNRLKMLGLQHYNFKEADISAWKTMMPAWAERCRSWKHKSECEYVQAGEVPLIKGLKDDSESPICSCGLGKFPKDYLEDEMEGFATLNKVLNRYATRVAISPIFASLQVEDCDVTDIKCESCGNCGNERRKNPQGNLHSLLKCSKCKYVKYCSVECQKADRKRHKPFCNPAYQYNI